MWATHRGLSKPCANRASCPSPVLGSCGSGRCQGFLSGLHLQIQEITEQDWLLAILAGTAEPHDSAKMVALGASSLAEVAYVALCAFIDGVGDECGSLAERFPKELFLQVWQRSVAEAKCALLTRTGAKATAAATAWIRAQHTPFRGAGWSRTIVTRIVTDGVCGG